MLFLFGGSEFDPALSTSEVSARGATDKTTSRLEGGNSTDYILPQFASIRNTFTGRFTSPWSDSNPSSDYTPLANIQGWQG